MVQKKKTLSLKGYDYVSYRNRKRNLSDPGFFLSKSGGKKGGGVRTPSQKSVKPGVRLADGLWGGCGCNQMGLGLPGGREKKKKRVSLEKQKILGGKLDTPPQAE